ncbi:MAG: XdhC family protein [Dehalococcoidales bacterium]|nr:XdhC family protein [Dehalococcoidales bacterium]
MRDVFEGIVSALERNEKAALVTVTRTIGSTPRKAGAKMLVLSNGETVGTIGGGCVEAQLWREVREVMKSGRPKLFLQRVAEGAGAEVTGMTEMFIEPIG